MRVIGMLNWYEESPSWLAECVASAAKLCDHIIAFDGAYALFPGALRRPGSGSDQAEVIRATAYGLGIGCTVHEPRHPWWGGEVEKRNMMMQFALQFAELGTDWLFRIDADEVLTTVPPDTRDLLGDTNCDVAELIVWFREELDIDSHYPMRCLYRAVDGMRIEQAHHIVTVPDGDGGRRYLVGIEGRHKLEPALTLDNVRMEHRREERDAVRKVIKEQYYLKLPQIEVPHA